ncbi:uncharacterized protein LOC111111798 isoform X2 [Crassostrea virginica]
MDLRSGCSTNFRGLFPTTPTSEMQTTPTAPPSVRMAGIERARQLIQALRTPTAPTTTSAASAPVPARPGIGMECDMAVSMMKELQGKNINVESIVMDDDTTTLARARKEVKAGLKKKSHANHAKKHFTNRLYALQITKKYKQLGYKTISHLK